MTLEQKANLSRRIMNVSFIIAVVFVATGLAMAAFNSPRTPKEVIPHDTYWVISISLGIVGYIALAICVVSMALEFHLSHKDERLKKDAAYWGIIKKAADIYNARHI